MTKLNKTVLAIMVSTFVFLSLFGTSYTLAAAPRGNKDADKNMPLSQVLANENIKQGSNGMKIVVDKSDKTLSIYHNDTWLKSYHVELGDGGSGDKQISGDHKTPEGTFYVCEKSVLSPPDKYLGTRWLRLSYPNIEDANRGLTNGIIDKTVYQQILSAIQNGKIPPQRTALGGGVGIHGGGVPELGSNWTWGCVGLTNNDVEDFFDYVNVGTPVIIKK